MAEFKVLAGLESLDSGTHVAAHLSSESWEADGNPRRSLSSQPRELVNSKSVKDPI